MEFYHESLKIFKSCQEYFAKVGDTKTKLKTLKIEENDETDKMKKQLTKYAKLYSELLSRLLTSKDLSEEERKLFKEAYYIWRLCEILYVPEDPISPIAPDLLNWLEIQDTDFVSEVENTISKPIEDLELISWNVIQRATIRGNLAAVSVLLETVADACTRFYRNMILDVRQLIDDKPDLPANANVTIIASYVRAWRIWDQAVQDEILALDPRWGEYGRFDDEQENDDQECDDSEYDGEQERLGSEADDEYDYDSEDQKQKDNYQGDNDDTLDVLIREHLVEILEIVNGNHETILRLSENWLEGVVAIIVYAQPTINRNDIGELINQNDNIDMMNDPLMDIYHSFLSFDIPLGLCLCHQWWLTAHLDDLLKYTDLLQDQCVPGEASMDEYSKAEYARYLVEKYQEWPLAIEYLSHCPTYGSEWISELVQNAKFTSSQMAEDIYTLCSIKGIKDVAGSISSALADQLLVDKKYSEAIRHYLEAGDHDKAEETACKVLDEYLATGQIELLKDLPQADDSYSPDGCYWVLLEYNEFHRLYKQCGDYEEAAKRLSKIMNSQKTPMRFWPALLLDALVFLEGEEMYFGEEQTYKMMGCLEDLTMDQDNEKYLQSLKMRIKHVKADASDKDADSIVEMLRFALSRNLARSVSH
ncbi:Nup85 nucleoporin-domain-containing protein [Umbelopsis sp. PMI_123]|nr:Nup85 nucleoporin-domain-containing protein [Umbelopsis sp. PMI_123]